MRSFNSPESLKATLLCDKCFERNVLNRSKITDTKIIFKILQLHLRWLEIVSSTYFDGSFNHSLSLDATIMVSKNCPTIGEHIVTIFVTQ